MTNTVFIVAIAASWLLIGVGGWLGWQLLRQNGRLLLRLDELEQRFDELEFGEADGELANESQGRASHSVGAEAEDRDGGAQGTDAPYPEEGASRFRNRSLARSKIKRDGLKAGTSAPSFRLPRLDAGELSLEELRGKRVLLVFSDPHCGPCNALAPELEKVHRQQPEVEIVMISKGEPKENRAKVKEHGLTFPVVLQQRWEISRLYAMFATPIAYLINEQGIIACDLAIGVEAILALLSGELLRKGKPQARSFALQPTAKT